MKKFAIAVALAICAPSLFADVSITDRRSAKERLEQIRSRDGSKKTATRERRVSKGISIDAQGSIALVDASGLQYLFNDAMAATTVLSSASGAAYDATYTTPVLATTTFGMTTTILEDAFDGYNGLAVNGVTFAGNGSAIADADCAGREFTWATPQVVTTATGTLSVNRKFYVPDTDEFARWLDIITNTGGVTETVTITKQGNLGSDELTTVEDTSSGDTVVDPTDSWIVTNGDLGDPRLAHVFQGPGNPEAPLATLTLTDPDPLNPPAGADVLTWTYTFDLAPGETAIILNFASGQPMIAEAIAKADELDDLPAGTLACMTAAEIEAIVNFAPDLSVTKTDNPDPVEPGANFEYIITVENLSGIGANNVVVVDTLPAEVTFVSADGGTNFTCTQVGTEVTCTAATFGGNATDTITITVTAPPGEALVTNNVTITSDSGDTDDTNNADTEETTILPTVPNITGTKEVEGPGQVNAILTYTIVLTNTGEADQPDDPTSNEFEDTLSEHLTILDVDASSGTPAFNPVTNQVTWNGVIPGESSVTITIRARVELGAQGQTLSNQGTIRFDTDRDGINDTTTVTDDPSEPGDADPTVISIMVPGIPTMSEWGLGGLALLLAFAGFAMSRRA